MEEHKKLGQEGDDTKERKEASRSPFIGKG
jgi:hypothetical protein